MGTSMRYRFVVLGLAPQELAEAQRPCVLIGRQIESAEGDQSLEGPLMLYGGDDLFGPEGDCTSLKHGEYLVQFMGEVGSLPIEDIGKFFSGLEELSVGPLRCMEVGECPSHELSLRLEQVFNAKYHRICVAGS
jgi:hypothetical protein